MHPDGHVESSRSLDEDQMVDVKWRFILTRDVENFGSFIADQTYTT